MNNKYPWKQAMGTGIITGVFVLVFFSFFNFLNQHFVWGINPLSIRSLTGLVTLIILGVGIYLAMQATKQQHAGKLSYKQALLSGVVVAFTTGVIVAIFTFVYWQFMNPGLADYLLYESKKIMVLRGENETEMAVHLSSLQKELTMPVQVFEAFVGQSIGGTILSAIMGLFLRTKNK